MQYRKALAPFMFTAEATHAQLRAERVLNQQGFHFSNWIPADPDAEGEGTHPQGCMILKRKPNRFTTEYREIDPEGNIH